METLRFAFSGGEHDAHLLAPLTDYLSTAIGMRVLPTPLATYPALFETMRSEWCAIGWLPPLVAHDLSVCRVAAPLVTASRKAGSSYASCFVATLESRIWHAGQLEGKRVGWVSKLSAAGYVVPRMHLASLGYCPEGFFKSEKIYGTHAAVRRALGSECDVIATYVETGFGEVGTMPIDVPHRIVATSGPIPADVITASMLLPGQLRDRLFRALLAFEPDPISWLARATRLMRFRPVSATHWSQLEHWQDRGRRESDRVRELAPAHMAVSGSCLNQPKTA